MRSVLPVGVGRRRETIEFAYPPLEPARGRVAHAHVDGVPDLWAGGMLAKDWEYCHVSPANVDRAIEGHLYCTPEGDAEPQ